MNADSTRNHRALALVSVASAVGSLDLSLMFVAYPSIKAHFGHESITLVSWVLAAAPLATRRFRPANTDTLTAS